MTRGNQRDIARAKAAKKDGAKAKQNPGEKGLSLEARKQRDADIMRAKQDAAKAKK